MTECAVERLVFKETVVPRRRGSETLRLGQSYDFWRAYSLFVARVASFVSEWSEGANDATRDANKLYARQKSFDYHY